MCLWFRYGCPYKAVVPKLGGGYPLVGHSVIVAGQRFVSSTVLQLSLFSENIHFFRDYRKAVNVSTCGGSSTIAIYQNVQNRQRS